MSDLYQITDRCDTPGCSKPHVHDRNSYRRHWEKVEPCEHGNFDKHMHITKDHTCASWHGCSIDVWCEGAGLS